MTAGVAQMFAADFPQPAFQLAAIKGRIFTHNSSRENKLVAKGGRNGAAGFEQHFQMSFGRLLKTESGFPAVASMRVATG